MGFMRELNEGMTGILQHMEEKMADTFTGTRASNQRLIPAELRYRVYSKSHVDEDGNASWKLFACFALLSSATGKAAAFWYKHGIDTIVVDGATDKIVHSGSQ